MHHHPHKSWQKNVLLFHTPNLRSATLLQETAGGREVGTAGTSSLYKSSCPTESGTHWDPWRSLCLVPSTGPCIQEVLNQCINLWMNTFSILTTPYWSTFQLLMNLFSSHLKNAYYARNRNKHWARNRNKGRQHGHSPQRAHVPAGEKTRRSVTIQNAMKEVSMIY